MSIDTLHDRDTAAGRPERPAPTARMVARAVRDLVRRQPVLVTAVAMIAVQLAFRAWALAGGWFLIDDYAFLSDAVDQPLTLDYLFHPHNDHLQPFGFLLVWLTAQTDPYNWALTTAVTVGLQAVASTAALVFLLRLVGRRWAVLVPLGFYLFSVMTLPGYLWWCVAMLQVPLQIAAFVAMTCHLHYVRTGRYRAVVAAGVALAFGMLCDVKIGFVGVGLAFLSLYLNDATTWRRRVVAAVWGQRWAWATYGALFAAYLVLYLSLNPLGGRPSPDRVGIFEVMFRYTLAPVVAGGPWRWGEMNGTPLVPALPPEWAVTVVWVGLVLALAQAALRHRAVLWALAPVLVCVVINVVMVSAARGAVFGRVLGLEVRYLGDLAAVVTLAIAVIAAGLQPQAGPPRSAPPPPSWRLPAARVVGGVALAAVATGMVVSNLQYVDNWHSNYPAREYTRNVIRQAEAAPLTVADQRVPLAVVPEDDVVSSVTEPSGLFRPLRGRVTGLLQGNDLAVLDDRGIALPAEVEPRALAPAGPTPDCGYQVRNEEVAAPMVPAGGAQPLGEFWWGSIGYLASADGVVEVTAGVTEVRMNVERGLHRFVFLGLGGLDSVRLEAVTDTVVCVDEITVGDLAPQDVG